jgi:hypothetical protein
MKYLLLFLLFSACTNPCSTNTVRCRGKRCQVCIDDSWYTARTCREECFIKDDMPHCTEDVK